MKNRLPSGHWDFSWRKFRMNLLATLALGLALGSALASSVAAREGNWVSAVGLAAFSLLLALVISLTVVPHLLNRVRDERSTFRFKATREGWVYLLTLSVTGVAAFNSGNNLLFVIFSVELALLVVSEILSRLNLYRLQTTLELPEYAVAQHYFNVGLVLRNQNSTLPSFSMHFQGRHSRSAKRGFGSTREIQTDFSPMVQGYLAFLPGATEKKYSLPFRYSSRGRYLLTDAGVSSRFPFGFFEKTKHVGLSPEVLVLPALEPPEEFFETLPLLSGALEHYTRGWGTNLHLLREYSIQDPARFIDWKASAKTESLMFREFTREEDQKCCFVFDNSFSSFDETWRPAFEKAIGLCANAARHFHEMAYEIRLVTPEASTDFSKDHAGLLDILKILALIEPTPSPSHPLLSLASDKAFKIVFSASPRGEIPTSVWNSSHVVFTRELQTRN
jgi:uncharacterized protein (DUF58 family)